MKLCFITGANSIHSYRWIKYFADRGHEIHWITFVRPAVGNFDKMKLYCFKKPNNFMDFINFMGEAVRIRQLIFKINPDILHAHYLGINGIMGAFSFFHPFVFTAWGSDIIFGSKSKIRRPFIKFVLKKADLITCDAFHMQEAMKNLGADSDKIKIIYFGVDTRKMRPGPKNQDLLNKLDILGNLVIISLRNFEAHYNVETLIKAIPLIIKKIPAAKFIIAGQGSEEKYLKKIAMELGVMDSIRFTGFLKSEDILNYMRSSDIYVSTSLSDAGISSCTAEAMAVGLPVVITDSAENKKWIRDGTNGFIIPVKNPEILAEKITNLARDENLRKKVGENARRTIEEKNDYYKEMEKMENFYKSLIK